MPIYEYACTTCGHQFEKLMRMGAAAPDCPDCGAATRKLVSQSGFILKGSGWYKDHYGLKKSSGADKSAPASSGSDGATSPSSGGDSGAGTSTGAAATSTPTSSTSTSGSAKGSSKGSPKSAPSPGSKAAP